MRWSATTAPVAVLRITSRSLQAPAAGRAPVLVSRHVTVRSPPDWMTPPGALTARPLTWRSGAGVSSAGVIVTGAAMVVSKTLNA